MASPLKKGKSNWFGKTVETTASAITSGARATVKTIESGARAVTAVGRQPADASDLPNVAEGTDYVSAPTPPDRWFTPRDGWVATDENGGQPHLIMPTAKTEDALFPLEGEAIGELRVEILQAEGLPNSDSVTGFSLTGNKTDSYAFIVFEGAAARTSVARDTLNPQWGPDGTFRAFKFPVLKPYSVLYVSINDYDGSRSQEKAKAKDVAAAAEGGADLESGSTRTGINPDETIGRVAIQLGRLTAGCEYDCWFMLGLGAIEKPDGGLGYVRIRFSVTFKSERARMLEYVNSPTPLYIVPFNKSAYRKQAIFAKRGELAKEAYDWDVLQVYVGELKDTAKQVILFIAAMENIVFWRWPMVHLSIGLMVYFQVLISFPQLLPASCTFGLLVLLAGTYSINEDSRHGECALHKRPSFWELCAALIFNKRPSPIEFTPAPNKSPNARPALAKKAQPAQPATQYNPTTLQSARYMIIKDIRDSTAIYWEEKILGQETEEAEEKEETLAFQKALVEAEVAEFIDEGDDSVEEQIAKRREKERAEDHGFFTKVSMIVNPVAAFLGPVQKELAKLVPKIRQVRYMLGWHDRILTFWLAAALFVATLVLACIPWGFILHYTLRVAGMALFGPHMYFVGRRVEKMRDEAREAAREYREAGTARKREILDKYREGLMAEARLEVEKARQKHAMAGERAAQRRAFLDGHKYLFLNPHTRGNANIKYVAVAETDRSTVRPLAAGTPQPAAGKPPAAASASRGVLRELV